MWYGTPYSRGPAHERIPEHTRKRGGACMHGNMVVLPIDHQVAMVLCLICVLQVSSSAARAAVEVLEARVERSAARCGYCSGYESVAPAHV